MIKLFHLINDSSVERGGAQKVLAKLNEVERSLGRVDFTVFSKNWLSSKLSSRQKKGGVFWYAKLLFLFFLYRPDVVVMHSRMYLPFVPVFRMAGSKVIFYCHAHYRRMPYFFKIFSCDAYIAVSKSVERYLKRYVAGKPIEINYNPVVREYSGGRERSDIFTLNYVGALQAWKGVDLFLKFLNQYCLVHKFSAVVNLVGDGPQRSYLESLKLSEYVSVRMLGYNSDPYTLLNTSDTQVVSSLEEGFGMVAVEAIQNGSTLLYTNLPALNEVVGDDPYSVVYDPYDYSSFSSAFEKLRFKVSQGVESDVMEVRSRQAVQKFGAKAFVDKYVGVLSKVVGDVA